MKVYNQDKTEILETYDLEKGYLKFDKLVIHHEEQPEVKGVFDIKRWEENGVKKIKVTAIVKPVPYRAAYDERIPIRVYIPYTEEQLAKMLSKKYENRVEQLIRQKYSVSQELAILRQKDTKLDEFNEYFAYAENCKARVKTEFGL